MTESRRHTRSRNVTAHPGRKIALLAFAFLAVGAGSVTAAFASPRTTATAAGGGANVAAAKQVLTAAEAPVHWKAPGPALSVGQQLKGKTLFYITDVIGSEFSQGLLVGIKQATKLTGLNLVVTDGQGDPATASRLIQQAIGRKANAIVVSGVSSDQITAPLKAAKAAGIPVIEVEEGNPRIPPAAEQALGVFGEVSESFTAAGKALAGLAVAKSGSAANVIVFDVPGIGINVPYMAAFRSEMSQLCASCKLTVVHVLVSNFTTALKSQTTTAIQANPSANYVMPLFDLFIPYVLPAVAQLNAQGRVNVASWDADLEPVKAVKDGQMIADGGSPLGWYGWAIVDQSVRAMLGKAPVADENIPVRLFTTDTTQKLTMSTSANASWYGTADYVSEYTKLWGYR